MAALHSYHARHACLPAMVQEFLTFSYNLKQSLIARSPVLDVRGRQAAGALPNVRFAVRCEVGCRLPTILRWTQTPCTIISIFMEASSPPVCSYLLQWALGPRSDWVQAVVRVESRCSGVSASSATMQKCYSGKNSPTPLRWPVDYTLVEPSRLWRLGRSVATRHRHKGNSN